jgi:hypothetical protein
VNPAEVEAIHSIGCWAQALQCAFENGATPEQEEEWAAIYLLGGMLDCSCPEGRA